MAQATILQYPHPVFTALLAFVFLAERPTAATLACITLSLLGLVCMVMPYWESEASTPASLWPVMAGLGGALGSGIAYTLVRKLVATDIFGDRAVFPSRLCARHVATGGADFVWPTATGCGSCWVWDVLPRLGNWL